MDLINVKFYFVPDGGAYYKITVMNVKTIQRSDQQEMFFSLGINKPENNMRYYLINNDIVKLVEKRLKVRNKFKIVVVTLSKELQAIYLDQEDYMIFHEYLEEAPPVLANTQTNLNI